MTRTKWTGVEDSPKWVKVAESEAFDDPVDCMADVLRHARENGLKTFTVVTHQPGCPGGGSSPSDECVCEPAVQKIELGDPS